MTPAAAVTERKGLADATRPQEISDAAPGSGEGWQRVFDSLPEEHDYVVDEIEGCLPPGLVGTLYRNGPGKLEVGGRPFGHLFDGDGMLSLFAFDGRRVRYRNRFVRTNHYLGELTAVAPRFRGFGTQRPGGPLANALRLPANVANTSVTLHAGKLLALWEGGRPWRLDPDTLETVGEYDFEGGLKRLHTFSAHPKRDPSTGELFNFGVQYGPITRIRTYRVDRSGRLHHLRPVTLPYPVMNHDFALTAKHLVLVLDPIIVRPLRLLFGLTSIDGALRFDPSRSTRIVLVPRDGGKPRVAECEPFFHFHVNNAFEDGGDTVIDLVRYPDFAIGEPLRDFRGAGYGLGSALWRLRVSPSDTVRSEEVCPLRCEFPQHDWRRTTRAYRYSYLVSVREEQAVESSVIKVDHETGSTQSHDFGKGEVAGEPIFVPRSPDAAENDGWLLSVVYSAAGHRSRLVVLDARDVEADPVAVAHLRHHVPFGFHGTFTGRVTPPDQGDAGK